jgi:hypothetical protein
MKISAASPSVPTEIPDLELSGACLACGGDLSLRLRDGAARGVCRGCGGWTCPRVEREEHGVKVSLLAGGRA